MQQNLIISDVERILEEKSFVQRFGISTFVDSGQRQYDDAWYYLSQGTLIGTPSESRFYFFDFLPSEQSFKCNLLSV